MPMGPPRADASYAGSIPAIYDECLGPFLFAPYARQVVQTAMELAPSAVLETAAGTGIVTQVLGAGLPDARIVSTDLNADMLEVARKRVSLAAVTFLVADAQELPFEDGTFDLVLCQFGAMFFPDRPKAYSEARRVLGSGGKFMFSVWDRIEANPASHVVEVAIGSMFAADPPLFLSRTPYGYWDEEQISAELQSAGFANVQHRRVQLDSVVHGPELIARGLCQGSPLGKEIEQRRPEALPDAISLATEALIRAGYGAGSTAKLSAQVWMASDT